MSIAHFTDIFDFPAHTAWAIRWRFWAVIALFLSAASLVLLFAFFVGWMLIYRFSAAGVAALGISAAILAGNFLIAFRRKTRKREWVSHI